VGRGETGPLVQLEGVTRVQLGNVGQPKQTDQGCDQEPVEER